MHIRHTLSQSRPAWRLATLFALLLAALMFLPSVALAQSPPGTPSSVTVTRADGTLAVSGYAVSNATKYHITYTSNGGKSWNAAASPADNYSSNTITIGGADNNKTYTVGVRAGNAHGWSGWRNSQPAKPFRIPPPDAPSSVTVTRSHGALTASWNAVTGATSYHITYTSNKGASWSLAALNHASSSITISGVDNNKTYIVGVRARNAHGWSGWRNSPPAGPYGPPAIPSGLRATSGNQRVTLSWDNPSDSSITGYEYQYRAGGSWSAWTDIAGSTRVTTSFDKSGLTNGTEYRFKLRAVNGHGASLPAPGRAPWYVAATPNDGANIPKPPGTSPPATPASVTATLEGDTLQAGWPADELAVSYHVTYSSDGGASWSLAALNHPSNAITISIDNSKTYIVAVRAGNDSGWSGWRSSAPVGLPALTVSNITATTATLSIANHSGAWHYKRTGGPADATCNTVGTGTTAALSSLHANTSYAYTAYSDGGCATALDAVTFSTQLTVSNLSESSYNSGCNFNQGSKCGLAFTTGGNGGGYTLNSVAAKFLGKYGTLGDIVVTLRAAKTVSYGDGKAPADDYLATLRGSNPDTPGTYAYTCSGSGCALSPNTTYFVQTEATSGTGLGAYYIWDDAQSNNETLVPSGNGWTLSNGHDVYDYDEGQWLWETSRPTFLKVSATSETTLAASSVTATTATLTLSHYSTAWWLKRTTPADTTCKSKGTTATESLTTLTAGTSYTYEAYSKDGCADADEIATVTFSTPSS